MIRYNNIEYRRAIIIGDIHACITELLELFSKVKPMQDDLLVSVGDLVDRGNSSLQVIRFLREVEALVVKGNHDDKWVRLKTNQMRELLEPGYKNKMRPLHPHNQQQFNLLDKYDWDWLRDLPQFINFAVNLQIYYVVHGGFIAHQHIDKQDPKITCRLRYVDKTTGLMKTNKQDFTKAPPDSVYWTEKWNRSEHVIYGHEARDEVDITNGCFGIDTSAVYGNQLTAMIIDSDNNISFESVKAKKAYWSKQIGLHD